MSRLHTLWLKAHRWVGLAIAAPLVLVALSGSLLVFEDSIDRALNPQTSFVTPGGQALPLDEIVHRVKRAYPDIQLGSFTFPERPDIALQLSANSKQQGPISIGVNQYTGEVLGVRTADEREAGLARRIHLLHTRLFGGQIGEWLVGIITFLTLFMAIAGLVLWWPRKIYTVKTTASGRRINFDLHNVFGFYASAVFLFIALTGMMISFEQWTDPMFRRMDATPVPPLARESVDISGQPMSADALASAAQSALPGAFLRGIGVPNGGKGAIVAMMKYPEDRTPGGRSRVVLDQYSGRVLTLLNTRTAPTGTRFINIKRSLHTGDIFGGVTQALYFVTCLMLAGQVITGILIWLRAKPARQAR